MFSRKTIKKVNDFIKPPINFLFKNYTTVFVIQLDTLFKKVIYFNTNKSAFNKKHRIFHLNAIDFFLIS